MEALLAIRPISFLRRRIGSIATLGLAIVMVLPRAGHASPPDAASGTVFGRVTDAETGSPLPGAAVYIEGTSIGAAADLDGEFRIPNAPEGEQVLAVSFLGYRNMSVPVTIVPGESIEQDVALTLDVLRGGEVLITAQAEGQVAAINQQLSSNTIVNIVSAARIQELPDVNAAESVGRLPGISIVRNAGEGQKVVVRGLSPKYNSVTVNKQRLPSTEFGDRSIDLSMVSSDMLSGIEVTKALTPDQDGDAIGGSVNFRLMDAPSGLRTNLRLQSGYNDQQTSFESYKGTINASNRFLRERLGVMVQANLERADRGSDVFDASYSRIPRQVAPGEQVPIEINSLNLTDRFEIRNRYGASLVLDYRLPSTRLKASSFVSRLNRDETTWQKSYSTTGQAVSYSSRDRDIKVDVLSNALGGEHTVWGSSLDWTLAHSLSRQRHPYDNAFIFSEVAAFDPPPDRTRGPAVIPTTARNRLNETFLQDGDFRKARMLERDLGANTNLQIPFTLGTTVTGSGKVGAKYQGKHRSNDETAWFLPFAFGTAPDLIVRAFPDSSFVRTLQGRLGIGSFLDSRHDPGDFLDGQYEIGPFVDYRYMAEVYERIGDNYFRTRFTDMADFRVDENIAAAYAMTEINLGRRRLMILPGVRYEHTYTHYDAKRGLSDNDRTEEGFIFDTTSTQRFSNVLPMVHVRYRFTDWFDVRLAYTHSLSRPDYPLYSPQERIRDTSRRVDRGNPQLRPATSTNYDAVLSFYRNRLGLFTVAGFYKDIDDVIYVKEKTILDPEADRLPAYTRGHRLSEPINNPHATTIKGVEIEWQTHFTYLPGFLSGLVLNVNYSRIASETKYEYTLLRRSPDPPFAQTQIDTFRVGRMLDQPQHIANLSIGYDLRGFSGRISMLYQETNLTRLAPVYPEEDGLTGTYIRWDLSLQQKIGSSISFFFNMNNLSDRADISSLGVGFPTRQEFYGWTADLGVRYRN